MGQCDPLKIGKLVFFINRSVLFAAMISLAILLTNDYINEKTTSSMLFKHETRFPHAIFSITTLSEPKLKGILNLPAEFWETEDKKFERGNISAPFMCQLLQALQLSTPFIDKFDDTQTPEFADTVQTYTALLEKSDFVKDNGIAELIRHVSEDPKKRISDVTDMGGRSVSHSVKIKDLGSGPVYDVFVNESALTNGRISQGGVIVHIPRFMSSDHKCRRKNHYGALTFRDYEEGNSGDGDYVFLNRLYDYKMSVSIQQVKRLNSVSSPCLEDSSDNSGCYQDCLDKRYPCDCPAVFYGETDVSKVTSVTKMCHQYLSPFLICQHVRTFQHNLLASCDKECLRPCERTFYHVEMTKRDPVNATHQAVQITTLAISNNFHITEFFVYNWVRYLCGVTSLISSFFGYSFMTAFHAAAYFLKKLDSRDTQNI